MVQGHGPTFLEQLGKGVGAAAEVAKAVLPIVEAINTEAKYQDVNATSTSYNPGTNSTLLCITNTISQGLDDFNRIGNSILAKDINIKFFGYWTPTVNSVLGNIHRVTIFCWKENAQQNAPTEAKVFESPTTISSPFNKDYTDQMVILKDKYWALNAPINASVTQNYFTFKFYKKLDWHMRWSGTTNQNTQNHIYIFFRSANTAIANAVSTSSYSRINYTDN